MKKIIALVLAVSSLFFLTVSKSLAEWTVGLSVTSGVYEAEGSETQEGDNEVSTAAEEAKFTFPSIFVEYNLGSVSVGLDVIPGSIETTEQARTDINNNADGSGKSTGNDGGASGVTNKVSVEFSRHVTLYSLMPIMDSGAFVKAGIHRMDITTKETLGTGSKYPDDTVFGGTLGLGYQHDTDAGFVRAEIGYSTYESISIKASNTANKVDADVDGEWARISVGHTF